MEFLYKLYSNDYFGIGLFIVITILAFSFLVILFFGKKDEKVRNSSEVDNENGKVEQNIVEEKNEEPELTSMTIDNNSTIEDDNVEMVEEFNPFITNNIVLNSDFISSEVDKKEINENKMEEENTYSDIFDFNVNNITTEPNNSKSDYNEYNEPTEIETKTEVSKNETFSEPIIENFDFSSPAIPLEKTEDIFSSNNEPVQENQNNQFSSVYVTKQELDLQQPEIIEAPESNPVPMKPEFDLPKLNKQKNTNDSIIKAALNEMSNTINNPDNLSDIFDNVEEDTYTIEK